MIDNTRIPKHTKTLIILSVVNLFLPIVWFATIVMTIILWSWNPVLLTIGGILFLLGTIPFAILSFFGKTHSKILDCLITIHYIEKKDVNLLKLFRHANKLRMIFIKNELGRHQDKFQTARKWIKDYNTMGKTQHFKSFIETYVLMHFTLHHYNKPDLNTAIADDYVLATREDAMSTLNSIQPVLLEIICSRAKKGVEMIYVLMAFIISIFVVSAVWSAGWSNLFWLLPVIILFVWIVQQSIFGTKMDTYEKYLTCLMLMKQDNAISYMKTHSIYQPPKTRYLIGLILLILAIVTMVLSNGQPWMMDYYIAPILFFGAFLRTMAQLFATSQKTAIATLDASQSSDDSSKGVISSAQQWPLSYHSMHANTFDEQREKIIKDLKTSRIIAIIAAIPIPPISIFLNIAWIVGNIRDRNQADTKELRKSINTNTMIVLYIIGCIPIIGSISNIINAFNIGWYIQKARNLSAAAKTT